jgi:hypothetical protein
MFDLRKWIITTLCVALAVMEFSSLTVALPSAEAAIVHTEDNQSSSSQSSISSVRFTIPSSRASFSSIWEENHSSYLASMSLRSPTASRSDTGAGMSYENLAPDMTFLYGDGLEKSAHESMSELPPIHEGDGSSVGTAGTSLASLTPSLRRPPPQLDIRIRWSKSRSEELAVAVSQPGPMNNAICGLICPFSTHKQLLYINIVA